MRKLALLALVLVGCGDGFDVPACEVLAPAPGVSQPCVYSAPASMACSDVRSVLIDGVPMDDGTYSVQCGSDGRSIVWLQPHGQERCSEWVVEACVD